jgi:4'-phosphopantetheinyl transferase
VIPLCDRLSEWTGSLPRLLGAERTSPEGRRALLHAAVARTLSLPLDRVLVEHGEGRPPRVAAPLGSGLYLSSATRGSFAVLGVARAPIGVDVEVATPDLDIPWGVLHPIEAQALKHLRGAEQARSFVRLWSIKEAYVKALGVGFEREPSSFVVQIDGDREASVTDPHSTAAVAAVATHWRGLPAGWAAVSALVLARSP